MFKIANAKSVPKPDHQVSLYQIKADQSRSSPITCLSYFLCSYIYKFNSTSQYNWLLSRPFIGFVGFFQDHTLGWSALIHFETGYKCMVLKVIRFDLVWLALICFDWIWPALAFYVWSWKESIQLVYKWSSLIHFDLVWSSLICFKILCMVLKGVNSIGLQVICFDQLWSTLKFYVWSWKESIQLVCK